MSHNPTIVRPAVKGQTSALATTKPAPGVAEAKPSERVLAVRDAAHTSRAEIEQAPGALVAAPKNFAVVDLRSANWVIRKIHDARAYAEAVKEWAEAEARRAQAEEDGLLTMFGPGLRAVLEAEIERAKGRRKSVNLPAGTMGLRAEPQRLRVEDEAAALEWARKHCPDAIRVTERISRTALNQHFASTGQTPSGCALQDGAERFFIR